MIGFLVIVGLVLAVVGVWMLVLSIRFLSAGRRAFDHYVEINTDPVGRAVPMAPSGRTTAPPQRKWITGP